MIMRPEFDKFLQGKSPREILLAILPFSIILVICLAGSQFEESLLQMMAALLTTACTFIFGFKSQSLSRILFLMSACAVYFLAFGRISTTGFFRFLADVAVYALPPLVIHLLFRLVQTKHRLIADLGMIHVYGPMGLMILGSFFVNLFWQEIVHERLQLAAIAIPLIYWFYYAVILFFIGLGFLNDMAGTEKPKQAVNALQLEDEGKFVQAGHLYEKEGSFEKSADMAQRGGQWLRAAELYKQAGDLFRAGEMYFRAGRLEDALVMYERSGTIAAAAKLCLQLGKHERAAELLEKCGEPEQALQAIESAGKAPSPELYVKARQYAKAVSLFRLQGNLQRAAEIAEFELHDVVGAAQLYDEAGLHRRAGELFDSAGKKKEAIEAYLKSPDTTLQAARSCYESQDMTRARQILEKHAGDDEEALMLLARIHWKEHNIDEAIKTLQQLKRRHEPSGAVCYLLGRSFMAKGLPELAEPELRLATCMPLDPEESLDAPYHLGRVLEVLGRKTEAIEIYQGIIMKDFHFMDAESRYRMLKSAEPQPQEPAAHGMGLGETVIDMSRKGIPGAS